MVSKKHMPWHRKLSRDWQRAGVLENCEIQFPGECLGNYGLAPCHSKDRDEIHTEADYREVVGGCQRCHFIADREMPKEERLRLFKDIIANRNVTF